MRYFMIMWLMVIALVHTEAQQLAGGEYFFDTAPSHGAGNSFTFPATDTINTTLNIPVSSLTPGFHNVFIRVRNISDRWSHYEGRTFYVLSPASTAATPQLVSGEWFVDTDPGLGQGTSFSFTQADTVNTVINIPASGFTPGFHNLFIRAKNTAGVWSHYEGRTFYVLSPASTAATPQLVSGEWFVDTDPGLGRGTAFSFTQADTVNTAINVNTAALSNGYHYLFLRVKNTDNRWSHYEGRRFKVCNSPLLAPVISGSTSVCEGATLALNAGTVPNATSYRWTGPSSFTLNGQALSRTGASSSMAGTYQAIAIRGGTAACDTSDAAQVTVTINALPSNQVQVNGTTITAVQSGATYQWRNCDNNQSVQGANASSFTPIATGNYGVIVTSPQGCTATSTCSNIIISGLFDAERSDMGAQVFPNPTFGLVNLVLDRDAQGTLYNSLGQKIAEYPLFKGSTEISLSGQPSGIYYLMLLDSDNRMLSVPLELIDGK